MPPETGTWAVNPAAAHCTSASWWRRMQSQTMLCSTFAERERGERRREEERREEERGGEKRSEKGKGLAEEGQKDALSLPLKKGQSLP